jgi:hypothetical protein
MVFACGLNFHDIASRNSHSDDPRIPLSVSFLEADSCAERILGDVLGDGRGLNTIRDQDLRFY